MTRSYTQKGTFSVAILLPVTILITVLAVGTGIKNPELLFAFIPALIILVFCLMTFYKLTITISEDNVSFTMGSGLVKRVYSVSEIASCKPVRNSPLTGIGIRLLTNGWLYNVSGLGAIELSFLNKKTVVRIGTDDAENISTEINKILGQRRTTSLVHEKSWSSWYLMAVLILLSALFPALILFAGSREHVVEITNNTLNIKGIYSITISIDKIISIDTVTELPSIKRRTNGFATSGVLKGNFTGANGEKMKLFIRKGRPPYLFIKTNDQIVYMNFIDTDNTIEIYNKLLLELDSNN